jgi:hypothetical protein
VDITTVAQRELAASHSIEPVKLSNIEASACRKAEQIHAQTIMMSKPERVTGSLGRRRAVRIGILAAAVRLRSTKTFGKNIGLRSEINPIE